MNEHIDSHKLKEDLVSILKKRGVVLGAVIALVIGCMLYAPNSISANTRVGDRELPIYCVDTQEKKVALSFDGAWGDGG